MAQWNEDLGRQFLPTLILEFGKRGHHKARGHRSPYDPWWWPISPARTLGHWGLVAGQEMIMSSLCEVPQNGGEYPDFRGSLAAKPNCIIVLGERPSFNTSFGSAVSKLHKRIRTIGEAFTPEQDRAPSNVHVCDLVKFRGEPGFILDGPDPAAIISLSMNCLTAELNYLDPVLILRTDLAKKAMKKIRRSFAHLVTATFERIDQHPGLVEVLHWSSNKEAANWPKSIKLKFDADPALSARVHELYP